jgi:hypothetical protein
MRIGLIGTRTRHVGDRSASSAFWVSCFTAPPTLTGPPRHRSDQRDPRSAGRVANAAANSAVTSSMEASERRPNGQVVQPETGTQVDR